MGWAAVRRPRGILLPQGAGPAGCTPHFLFPLVEKKTGRARSKRKDRLDALRRVRASARRGSADRCKRRFWPAFGHAIIFCNFWDCRPVADGAEIVGVVIALRCFSFRCRWPVVDESLRSGPMRASASTNARAARSEAERAEREAGQMRSCTPTPSAPSATGRQYRPHRRPKRARRQGQIGAGTGTPTPVRAEGHCTGARPAPFSLTPGAARSLFGATKKRMGGALPSWHPS